MANEAVLVYEISPPLPFTCADGTGIEKGTWVKLADPATVSASSALNDVCGGVIAQEKIANDGRTKVAVYRDGIFKAVASGNITTGVGVIMTSGGNKFESAAVNSENIWGIPLETATDGESFLLELRPTTMNLA